MNRVSKLLLSAVVLESIIIVFLILHILSLPDEGSVILSEERDLFSNLEKAFWQARETGEESFEKTISDIDAFVSVIEKSDGHVFEDGRTFIKNSSPMLWAYAMYVKAYDGKDCDKVFSYLKQMRDLSARDYLIVSSFFNAVYYPDMNEAEYRKAKRIDVETTFELFVGDLQCLGCSPSPDPDWSPEDGCLER